MQRFAPEEETVNYSSAVAAFCLDVMVQQKDLMSARERIKMDRETGKTLEEQLQSMKKLTAGNLFKTGNVHVGKTVFQARKQNVEAAARVHRQKYEKKRQEHEAMVIAAEELLATGVDPNNPKTIKETKILLAPFRRTGDKALPKHKKEIIELYFSLRNRLPLVFDDQELVDESGVLDNGEVDIDNTEEEEEEHYEDNLFDNQRDALDAMLTLGYDAPNYETAAI